MGESKGMIAMWRMVDQRLRAINDGARKALRWLRFGQILMIIILLTILGCAGGAIFYPEYAGILYFVSIGLLSIALIPWIVLISLPLRLKSVTRLIDKGYPANAREMAIRVMAQKLHDESIQTEELLVETAINEGKKAYRKLQERKAEEKRRRDAPDDEPYL